MFLPFWQYLHAGQEDMYLYNIVKLWQFFTRSVSSTGLSETHTQQIGSVSVSAMLVYTHQKNIAQVFILVRYFFVSICPVAIPGTYLMVFLVVALLLCWWHRIYIQRSWYLAVSMSMPANRTWLPVWHRHATRRKVSFVQPSSPILCLWFLW